MIQKLENHKTISVVISTREINVPYIEHIRKTSGNPNIEILSYVNKGDKSLSEIYNTGLKEAKNEIILFIHDDLIFDTNNWCSKLLAHFNSTDYGIIGVAGTDTLLNGCWWSDRSKMYGVVNHIHNGKKHTNHYSAGLGNGIKPVVVIDGLFIAVRKSNLVSNFITKFNGFHFYDIPFCLENYLNGIKIGVITNIRLTHLSVGQISNKWLENKKLFEEIYKNNLPCVI